MSRTTPNPALRGAPLRAFATFAALVGLLLPVAPASADILPRGKKRVSVSHSVTGLDAHKGHTFALVTTSNMKRDRVSVRTGIKDGSLAVTSGYMMATRLVALTPEQAEKLKGLVKHSGPGSVPKHEDEKKNPLRTFIDSAAIAKSPVLGFRTYVPDASKVASVHRAHTLVSVGAEGIVFKTTEEQRDKGGKKL